MRITDLVRSALVPLDEWDSLNESSSPDDYLKMFSKILEYNPNPRLKSYVKSNIDWALDILGGNARVTWFLRLVKIVALRSLLPDNKAPWETEVAKYCQKFGANAAQVEDEATVGSLGIFKTQMEHYLSRVMTERVPKIGRYTFTKPLPSQIIEDLSNLEEEVSTKEAGISTYRWIPPSKLSRFESLIMKFPDGKAWFDLETNESKIEGQSCNNCGTAEKSGSTLLSLREPHKYQGEIWWQSLLLAELTDSGNIRQLRSANEKPDEEFHPYIVALLKRKDLISGFEAPSYRSTCTFDFDDLSDEEKEEVRESNPDLESLESLYTLYKRVGMSSVFVRQLDERLGGPGIRAYDENSLYVWEGTVESFCEDYIENQIGRMQWNSKTSKREATGKYSLQYFLDGGEAAGEPDDFDLESRSLEADEDDTDPWGAEREDAVTRDLMGKVLVEAVREDGSVLDRFAKYLEKLGYSSGYDPKSLESVSDFVLNGKASGSRAYDLLKHAGMFGFHVSSQGFGDIDLAFIGYVLFCNAGGWFPYVPGLREDPIESLDDFFGRKCYLLSYPAELIEQVEVEDGYGGFQYEDSFWSSLGDDFNNGESFESFLKYNEEDYYSRQYTAHPVKEEGSEDRQGQIGDLSADADWHVGNVKNPIFNMDSAVTYVLRKLKGGVLESFSSKAMAQDLIVFLEEGFQIQRGKS